MKLAPEIKLSIIIPVYNERKTIEEILEKVSRLPVEKEIIVVDDGSTDGTRELLEKIFMKEITQCLKCYFTKKIREKEQL